MTINQDWRGNTQSVMATLNASNHSKKERQQHDYYATDPKAIKLLLELETFNKNIWECACGEGHLSKALQEKGYDVKSTDLIDRGFGDGQIDFLGTENQEWNGDIITNPPFIAAQEFVEKSISIIPKGKRVAMFLRIQFLEGVKRRQMFNQFPPKAIYVSSRNMRCAKNGDFKNATGNASTYCWFIWEKGYKGTTELKWFN